MKQTTEITLTTAGHQETVIKNGESKQIWRIAEAALQNITQLASHTTPVKVDFTIKYATNRYDGHLVATTQTKTGDLARHIKNNLRTGEGCNANKMPKTKREETTAQLKLFAKNYEIIETKDTE